MEGGQEKRSADAPSTSASMNGADQARGKPASPDQRPYRQAREDIKEKTEEH